MGAPTLDAFSQSYAEARDKFLAAAEAAGLDPHAYVHPMLGRDGEVLALDVVRDGAADAEALLVISSGCHGVEGFCGSGVQVAMLRDAAWRDEVKRSGVAVLYAHALNPHGFSWWRRVTQENVDLNRNFHDFSKPLPENPDYDEIAHLIVPSHWPPAPEVEQGLMAFAARHGERALQRAISGGQHRHPEGLFYGGINPTWSNHTVRGFLRDHAQRCRRLAWIDLHTGLGPSGHGERISACRDDAATIARARRWWGAEVTSIYDGSSSSALLTGLMWLSAYEECPQAEYTGIALEYGTIPLQQTLQALRADQWLENHPEADEATRVRVKRDIRDAFYTDTDAWKLRILEQAFDGGRGALKGLSAA